MKANSSRVPGKNFRDFCGKPLFRWVLDSLIKVKEIEAVIINTDARDILIENGLVESDRVIIRQRPTKICGDDVSMNLVISDDLENVKADIYLMTHTTNPLLSCETIKFALEKFKADLQRGASDSLFTVNKIQTRFYREDATAINHDPENLIPTQNLEPWYEENSNLYLFTSESFAKSGARIGLNPSMHVTPLRESIDIDTPEDWDMGIATTQHLLDVGLIKK
jgi:CMP-N-acetylneuraminic acid synthetase